MEHVKIAPQREKKRKTSKSSGMKISAAEITLALKREICQLFFSRMITELSSLSISLVAFVNYDHAALEDISLDCVKPTHTLICAKISTERLSVQ